MSEDYDVTQVMGNRKTTQELVTEAIRYSILNGIFRDGEPIDTKDLEEKFGVSRMPIRIALQQLESEGLVHLEPHKKAVAVRLSPDEVRKICDIRCELEALATRSAINNLNESTLNEMKELLSKMESASVEDFLKLNMAYHDKIYQYSENEMLRTMIKQLRNNVERYLKMYLTDDSHFESANKEHYEIYYALLQKDQEKAETMVKKHLRSTCEAIAKILEKRDSNTLQQ